jgi:alanine-glyoxylate transaminase/serine-glyoxylate transaminase/serine-pyruvate transaminase
VIRQAATHFNLSLGAGLGSLRSRVFRIGHLGSLNELEVLATLAGTEMALRMTRVPVQLGSGVRACQARLLDHLGASSVQLP